MLLSHDLLLFVRVEAQVWHVYKSRIQWISIRSFFGACVHNTDAACWLG